MIGWDEGTRVEGTSVRLPAPLAGIVRSYRVAGVNEGGEGRPSEALAVGVGEPGASPVLVVDGFDRVAPPDEDVVDHQVVPALLGTQDRQGVLDVKLDTEGVQGEMLARQTDDFGIELHPHQQRLRGQFAQDAGDTPPAQTQHQDAAAASRGQGQERRRQGIPHAARGDVARAVEGGEGFVDDQALAPSIGLDPNPGPGLTSPLAFRTHRAPPP